MMKQFRILALASLLVALIGCEKHDDNFLPLDGEWVVIQKGQKTLLSTEMAVLSFNTQTATIGYSERQLSSDGGATWATRFEKYILSGDQLACVDSKIKIKSVTATRLEYIIIESSIPNVGTIGQVNVAQKAIDNYTSKLTGTWECMQDTNSSEPYRIRYETNGTYEYLIRNEAGEWIKSEQPISKYTLYGQYIVTQYEPKYDNMSHCDIWKIISIEDNVFTAKMSEPGKDEQTWIMKKVQ